LWTPRPLPRAIGPKTRRNGGQKPGGGGEQALGAGRSAHVTWEATRGTVQGDADDFSLAANAGQIETCYDGELAHWPVLECPTCPINFQVILPAILILSSTRPSNTHVQIQGPSLIISIKTTIYSNNIVR
jgi:hypothetical protein